MQTLQHWSGPKLEAVVIEVGADLFRRRLLQYRIRHLVTKYSDHVSIPVYLKNEVEKDEEQNDEEQNDEELAEADEHQATFLTSQPTTLGFGTMRPYQLEGLNWMIRLQENGVNGILADEVCTSVFFQCGRICMLGCFLLLFCM